MIGDSPFSRLFVGLEVTRRCTSRCPHCYTASSPTASQPDPPGETLGALCEALARAGVRKAAFSGGEPLLRADLEELIRFARGQGLAVNLINNGTLATPARARRLAAAGLPTAQVSLEAPDEELHDLLTGRRGAFAETLAGIASLQQAGIEVQTNTTITRPSADRIAALPAFLAGLGVRRCSLNLCIPTGTARTAADLLLPYQEVGPLLEEVRRAARTAGIGLLWYSPTPHCLYNPIARGFGNKSCAAMDGLLSVSPQGDVLPCSSYPQPLGNLLREEFSTIWFSAAARFFKEKRHAPAECQGCASFVACQGACPLYWQAVGTAELAGRRRAPSGDAEPGAARVPGPGGWVAAPAATS